jgi:DNA-binding response OmpR family regulator
MLIENSFQRTADILLPVEDDFAALKAPGAGKAAESSLSRVRSKLKALTPRKILVIDDDPEIRELVVVTVSRVGFRTYTAKDGEEGWNAFRVTPYDLVITDHEMPRMTGLKLIERMREISIEPPCILISGYMPHPVPDLMKIVHRGAVLPKPFSPTELIESVYGLLLPGGSQR